MGRDRHQDVHPAQGGARVTVTLVWVCCLRSLCPWPLQDAPSWLSCLVETFVFSISECSTAALHTEGLGKGAVFQPRVHQVQGASRLVLVD